LALFGKKDRDELPAMPDFRPEPRPSEAQPARRDGAQAATAIGPTVKVKGEVRGDEDVVVEGRIEGMIALSRTLQVGKTGVVEADIRAAAVLVHGRLIGNVIAEQKVEIFPTGRLEGNIRSPKISIHEGAHFKGNVDMSVQAPPPASLEVEAAGLLGRKA
jgi:cytoskeletal protein CcmA (bactofilin family)